MSRDVGELFGEGEGAPAPRIGLAIGLLVAGLVLAVLGMACTTAPGGLVVLGAWMVIEKEYERLESGYFPEEVRGRVETVRAFTTTGVLTVIVLFVVQGALLCSGFYDPLWMGMLSWVLGVA